MRYVLGIDGGGSKTACLAADEMGKLLGYGRGGPVNTNYVLRQEAVDSLKCAINTALEEAGLRGDQIVQLMLRSLHKTTGKGDVSCQLGSLLCAGWVLAAA